MKPGWIEYSHGHTGTVKTQLPQCGIVSHGWTLAQQHRAVHISLGSWGTIPM